MITANADRDYRLGFNVGTSKGVFVGTHDIGDWKGTRLGRFDVFAAPQDLNIDVSGQRILMTFKETAKELARRGNWLGYPCCAFGYRAYRDGLFAGLKDGSAAGKWFIPTREILWGSDASGHRNNLFDLKTTGDLSDTFCTGSPDTAHLYWSCSEHPDDPDDVWVVGFSGGGGGWIHKDGHRLSVRPVRVELAP